VSGRALESSLKRWLDQGVRRIGQISIEPRDDGTFALTHREDMARDDLVLYHQIEDASQLARFDDNENYRPLKTAPNLRHGWRLLLPNLSALTVALDFFYPGRLAAVLAWEAGALTTTSWRDTLNRQTGMYKIAATISDENSAKLIGSFCRSNGGCLRTILWPFEGDTATASPLLPCQKFEVTHDQTGAGESTIPLICQEACNLLVAEARKVAKSQIPICRPT
jgi:sirohydrochlorin cobaltochelatase